MSDTLATAASLLLTRTEARRFALSEGAERHLTSVIEASALVDEAAVLKEKVANLLRLAHVLRAEEDAPLASAAIERALHASPAAVTALSLTPATQELDVKGRAFEAFAGAGTARRAPTGHEPAPPGSFKPRPRPLR